MRFFEKVLIRNEQFRDLQRKPDVWAAEASASVMSHLQNCMNFRKQPGALEFSDNYEKWFPALDQLEDEDHWSLLQSYFESVEPRLTNAGVRKLKPVEKKQSLAFAQSLSELEQKAIVLFAIEAQLKQIENVSEAQIKLVAIRRPNGRIVLFSLG